MSTIGSTSTVLSRTVRYRTQPWFPPTEAESPVYDRFSRIPGADQPALARLHCALVGSGGLNCEMGHGLCRKGVGYLTLYDFDTVEPSNLSRQLFGRDDVGKNKAFALAKKLAENHATGSTVLEAHARSFEDARDSGACLDADVAIVGVDNNPTRVAAAEYFLRRRIPAVFLGVNAGASSGYVFVQDSRSDGGPCFQCLYPDARDDRRIHGCAGASIEILKVVAGIALYAVDSLIMARPRQWNYKEVFLDQGTDGHRIVARRPGCPLCSGP